MEGGWRGLLHLSGLLVRQLPYRITMVCILDGVDIFENDAHEEDLLKVLRFLVGLARDSSMPPAIKLLASSATKTVLAHTAFHLDDAYDDDALLSVSELPFVGSNVLHSRLDVEWSSRE